MGEFVRDLAVDGQSSTDGTGDRATLSKLKSNNH